MRETISIHTPAWGVTHHCECVVVVGDISIHTPAWGVTEVVIAAKIIVADFNPHPRVGGDTLIQKIREAKEISIHTPAWGVTACVSCR